MEAERSDAEKEVCMKLEICETCKIPHQLCDKCDRLLGHARINVPPPYGTLSAHPADAITICPACQDGLVKLVFTWLGKDLPKSWIELALNDG